MELNFFRIIIHYFIDSGSIHLAHHYEFKLEKYSKFGLFGPYLNQSWVILRKVEVLHIKVCQIVSTIEFYSTLFGKKPKWAQSCQYFKFIFLCKRACYQNVQTQFIIFLNNFISILVNTKITLIPTTGWARCVAQDALEHHIYGIIHILFKWVAKINECYTFRLRFQSNILDSDCVCLRFT